LRLGDRSKKEKKMPKRLYKIEFGRKIFGVCGGVAEYLNIDVVIVRIAWAVLALCWGTGILLYLICAFVLPNKSEVEQ
jgi:phage shock protein C